MHCTTTTTVTTTAAHCKSATTITTTTSTTARIHTRKSALWARVCVSSCDCVLALVTTEATIAAAAAAQPAPHPNTACLLTHTCTHTRANKLPIKRQDFCLFAPLKTHTKTRMSDVRAPWTVRSCSLLHYSENLHVAGEQRLQHISCLCSDIYKHKRMCVCVNAYTKVFRLVRVLRRTSQLMTLNSPK